MKKTVSMLLALCMLFSLCACGRKTETAEPEAGTPEIAEITPYQFPERTPVAFKDMAMDNFDADRMQDAIDTLTKLLEKDGSFEGICDAYDIIVDEFDKVNTDMNVAYIYYCFDEASEDLFEQYYEKEEQAIFYSDAMCIALSAAMESPYAEQLKAYINSENVIEDVSGYTAMTDEQFALNEENANLINEYRNMDENAGDEDYGELYLRLLDNLIATAEYEEDYDSFTDYTYARSYFRDYGPEDTGELYQWAKDFAVPAYMAVYDTIITYYDLYAEMAELSFTEEEIISTLKPYLSSFSSATADAFDALTGYELYDISVSDEKSQGGYTTNLYYYGLPFIYNCPYESYQDVETIVHEFGHFTEMYTNSQPMLYVYDCYDTSEIDSQGLEMLMLKYAGEIYGEEYADMFRLVTIHTLLSSIIDGCIFDEFQQKAVQMRMEGTLNSGREVTDLFISVSEEYFGDYAAQLGWDTSWYMVHHTFESPFYYISYATSATAALGFLVAAEENYETAVEKYNGLIEMGCDKGFSNTLDELGMPNPLTEKGCDELTEGLTDYINSLTDYDIADYAALVHGYYSYAA